jgi:hypothetical protein
LDIVEFGKQKRKEIKKKLESLNFQKEQNKASKDKKRSSCPYLMNQKKNLLDPIFFI